MPTFAIQYTYDHRAGLRDEHRSAHRAHLRALAEQGVLLASGPYTAPTAGVPATRGTVPNGAGAQPDEPPGALLLVRGASLEAVLEALDRDPFWVDGLVVARTAREWDPVIGPWSG